MKVCIRAAAPIVLLAVLIGCEGAGMKNIIQNKEPVETPTFSVKAGTYSTDTSVTISDSTNGATIYYTVTSGTTGTAPSTSSTQYTGPISVAGDGTTQTIEAMAAKSGMASSQAVVATYVIRYWKVYGKVTWDGILYYSTAGFPFPSLAYDTYYQIAPGTYNYKYCIYDGTYYYPAYGYYYSGTFTVTQPVGSDEYFTLYMATYGLVKSGAVSYIAPLSQSSKPLLTPNDLSKLRQMQVQTK